MGGEIGYGKFCFGLLVVLVVFASVVLVSADPTGADELDVTENESWSGSSTGEIVNISGGIISAIDVSSTTQNSGWKAFVGWVDGMYTLSDSDGDAVYDWSFATTGGQVYASRNVFMVDWSEIECATSGEIDIEDGLLGHDGGDNVSSTFNGTNTEEYTVAGTSIVAGDCFAINTYVSDSPQTNSFEEIVLHDGSNVVFATEIENGVAGFDDVSYDFQMIVPENATSGFSGSTSYYLYVEILS